MMKNTKMTQGYRVLVDDNFDYMDEDERWCLGEFASYEDALRAARKLVEDFFSEAKSGQTAEEIYDNYTSFGEDPFIMAFGGADQPNPPFSAWTYAKQLAENFGNISGEAPPLSLPPCDNALMNENHGAGETGHSTNLQRSKEDK